MVSAHVESTDIYHTDLFQRTQLPSVGSGVQVITLMYYLTTLIAPNKLVNHYCLHSSLACMCTHPSLLMTVQQLIDLITITAGPIIFVLTLSTHMTDQWGALIG